MKVGFIGTGNMGGALAHAAAQSPAPAELLLSNRTPEKAQALAQQLGATVSDNETIAQTCDYIFLGVKPQMMADLLARLRPILSRRQEGFVLVSMAAGLTLQRLGEMAGLSCPILRIMPNTACAVGAGLTLYVPSPEVTEEQLSAFLTLMSASGRLEPLEEHLIDAGSAVAGCGGAFVSLFLEALADGAVTCGLPRDKARRYAAQMVLGTAQLALQSDQHTATMKDAVCSPGGTTIAGVRALERGGQPVFADGGAALAGLSAREIGALAGRWAAFDRAENPSPEDGEERLEGLKKAWSTRPMSAFAGVCSNALARFRRRSGPNR